MKKEEKVAEIYLKTLGFENVEFEPDGNKTPDFLCYKKIAVEVRRLNYLAKKTNGKQRGIEKTAFPLIDGINGVLKMFGEWKVEPAWLLFLSFERPLASTKFIKKELEEKLREAIKSNTGGTIEIISIEDPLNEDTLLKINIIRSDKNYNDGTIGLGTIDDHYRGGFVLEKVTESLKFCIKEKHEKCIKKQSRYGKWWLLLIDNMNLDLDEAETKEIRKVLNFEMIFEKVIVLSYSKKNELFVYNNFLNFGIRAVENGSD